jgi:enoyl-CoA hydratase
MDLVLTGKNFSGVQAEQWGLAAKVVEGGNKEVLDATLKTAAAIASFSKVAVVAAKEMVNNSQDLGIREDVEYERRIFQLTVR